MPEALLEFILEQPDAVLLELLAWVRKDPARAIEELESVITRQAPVS